MNVIDELVNRFLAWPVPADVYPDGAPGKPGRTGTNLLTAQQAREMLEYVLAAQPKREAVRFSDEDVRDVINVVGGTADDFRFIETAVLKANGLVP